MPVIGSPPERSTPKDRSRAQGHVFRPVCLALVTLLLSSQLVVADHGEWEYWFPDSINYIDEDRGMIEWEDLWVLDCEDEFTGELIWMDYLPPFEIESQENHSELAFPGVSISPSEENEFLLEGFNVYDEPIVEVWNLREGENSSWFPSVPELGMVYSCYENPVLDYEDWHWDFDFCFDNFILDLENPIGLVDLFDIDSYYYSFFTLDGEPWFGGSVGDGVLMQGYYADDDDEDNRSFQIIEENLTQSELESIIDMRTSLEISLDSLTNLSQLGDPPTWNSSIEDHLDWKLVICGQDVAMIGGSNDEEEEYEWILEFDLAFNWVAVGCDACNVEQPLEPEEPEPEEPTVPIEPEEPVNPNERTQNNDRFNRWLIESGARDEVVTYGPAISIVSVVAMLGAALAKSESLRYPFSSRFWLTIAFLVGATRQDERGDYQRGRIVGILTFNQGMHLSALIRALGMGNHQASHHLRVLQDEGIIWSRRIGREVRFFTADVPDHLATDELPKPKIILTHDSVPHRILMFLSEVIGEGRIGANQKQIAKGIEASQQLVSYHIRALEEWGLVSKSRSAFGFQVEITSQGLEFLAGGEPPFEREELTEEQMQLFNLIADSLLDESV